MGLDAVLFLLLFFWCLLVSQAAQHTRLFTLWKWLHRADTVGQCRR